MRRALAAALLLAVAACAAPGAPKRTAAEVDRDRTAVADAVKAADAEGSSVHMTNSITVTGGDIPQGQRGRLTSQADGVVHEGRVRVLYKFEQSRNRSAEFDYVISGSDLFFKPHKDAQWRRSDAAAATALYPGLRLPLLHDTILLAKDVGSGSITAVNNGFARRYTVTPAPDQLEQLQSVAPIGQAEQVFLKTASARVDAYLTLTGDKLTRVVVHLKGTDPDNGEQTEIECGVDFAPAKVGAIDTPANATPVPPSEILGGS